MLKKFLVLTMCFMISLLVTGPVMAEGDVLAGKWKGDIDVQGNKLGIILEFNKQADGWNGSLDIPVQGAHDLPLDNIEASEGSVSFDVPTLPGGVRFEGKINGTKIEGDFYQSGYKFPFMVEKMLSEGMDSESKEMRDYTVGKYNIKEKEVNIPTEGGSLAGTLTIPEGIEGPVKGVILVAGSGPTDRDGNNPLIPAEINTLKEIAHYLSSKGIVTLRYDKRGIKGSSDLIKGGTPSFDKYKIDVINAVKYFKELSSVDEKKVFVLGHSEGATLATMAAVELESLNGVLLISGSGNTFAKTIRNQIRTIGEAYAQQGQVEVKEELMRALNDLFKAIREDKQFDINNYDIPDKLQSTYLSLIKQPEFAKSWLDVDPVKLLEKTDIPVSIIQGTNDSRLTLEDAKKLASAVPETRLDYHMIEGVNHYLKKAQPGNYAPDKRIHQGLLENIFKFVENR